MLKRVFLFFRYKNNHKMPFFLSFLLPFLCVFDSKIQWTTPTVHDFGEIQHSSEAKYAFTFKNLSDKPLVIDNVRTDCSCTTSDWNTAPILSNETGKITVSFDTKKIGYFRKKLTVWIRGQRQAEKLTIEGEVLSDKF
jgi:hypothetical protein